MKPSAADRRSPTRWDGAVILSVLILAASLFLLIYPHSGQGADLVTIQQGGHVTGTFYLSTLKEPLSVTVNGPYPLTVQLSSSGVVITQHQCPGGDCARTSLKAGQPGQIICLPNQTIITLSSHGSPLYDAVTW